MEHQHGPLNASDPNPAPQNAVTSVIALIMSLNYRTDYYYYVLLVSCLRKTTIKEETPSNQRKKIGNARLVQQQSLFRAKNVEQHKN